MDNFPVTLLIGTALGFLTGLGVGGGSLISRLLGEKKDGEAKSVASFSFWGSFVISLVYALIVLIFMDPFLYFLGATDGSIGFARDYAIYVVIIGSVPSTLAMTMSHLLRSEGYAKYASFGLGAGGILNILLDPLFMFVILEEGNEVAGAAIATLISNILVLVYFLTVYYVIRKNNNNKKLTCPGVTI